MPLRISPENSAISSNFKTAFSQSLKELLHQESWMHGHLTDIYQAGSSSAAVIANSEGNLPLKRTLDKDIYLYSNITDQILFISGNNKEQRFKEPNVEVVQPQTPLPFLGRSQSLVNIPLSLDSNKDIIHHKSTTVAHEHRHPPPQSARRKRCSSKATAESIKFQSLPHKHPQQQHTLRKPPIPPTRSKSVETKTTAPPQQQQQQYDVSQVELFASIQSRQAVTRHNKNMTLTSALVGVRQSGVPPPGGVPVLPPLRPEQQQPRNGRSESHSANNSGHLCVVQAMVHKEDTKSAASNSDADQTARRQQQSSSAPRSWDYERVNKMTEEVDSASIELTADQVRQLIRAISAAQQAATQSTYQQSNNNSNQVPERDVQQQPPNKQQSSGVRGLSDPDAFGQRATLTRNDSFEGHEEAVRMLVDAVRDIKHIALHDA